jgi:hypothetical protein
LTLNLDVPSKAVLLELLERIENHVSFDYPILYAINEMNYNIIEYGIAQRITISLSAYYYKDTSPVEEEVSEPELETVTSTPASANT